MPVRLTRRRYLAFKVSGCRNFSKGDLSNEIAQEMLNLPKESKISEGSVRVIQYEQGIGLGIIRCSHTFVDRFKLVLRSMRRVSGKPVAIGVIGVSGTVRSLKRKYLPGTH